MFVYLIGSMDGVYCKIGIAKDPKYRLSCVDTPKLPFNISLLAQYDAGEAAHFVEKTLHKVLHKSSARGEWFIGISPKDFLKRAKAITKEYIPKVKKPRSNPFVGTEWGTMSARERQGFILAVGRCPEHMKERAYAAWRDLMKKTEAQ
jgi:hypothetical protein